MWFAFHFKWLAFVRETHFIFVWFHTNYFLYPRPWKTNPSTRFVCLKTMTANDREKLKKETWKKCKQIQLWWNYAKLREQHDGEECWGRNGRKGKHIVCVHCAVQLILPKGLVKMNETRCSVNKKAGKNIFLLISKKKTIKKSIGYFWPTLLVGFYS